MLYVQFPSILNSLHFILLQVFISETFIHL